MLIINNALAKFVLFSVDSYTTEELVLMTWKTPLRPGRMAPLSVDFYSIGSFDIGNAPLFGFRAKLLAISSNFESLLVVPIVILLAAV